MPEELLNEYGLDAAIALGGSFLTAALIRFKAWVRGQLDQDAPFLRQFAAYLMAYAAAFVAIRTLDGFWRYAVIVVAASLAFAVTINGSAPLLSRSYVQSVGIALAAALVLWALYGALLLLFGIDLLAPRPTP
jgi:hypothetical protein